MNYIVAARTDVGRVRTNNEDSFISRPELGLFVVCDGMGGHAAGEVASRLVCETLALEIEKLQPLRTKFIESGSSKEGRELTKAVDAAVNRACREVYKKAEANPELEGMGTTCSMVLMCGNKGVLGHVGDSRVFLLRRGTVHQLSEDHTFVNELIKRGVLTKEQARNHPQGNVLSRAVGVQPSVACDTLLFDIDPGDTYLVCSDGLHNYYPHSEEFLTITGADQEQTLNAFIDTALNRGGHDNCTGILITIPAKDAAEQHFAASDRIAILKRIPLFAYLSYGELIKVLGITQLRRAAAGEEFVREGDRGDELYVILSGEVDVKKGGHAIVHLKAGVHIGEMALVDNAPRSASVVAATDANLLVMKRQEFFWIIKNEPVVASKLLWSFVQVLSSRLRETNEALRGAKAELEDATTDEVVEVLFDDGGGSGLMAARPFEESGQTVVTPRGELRAPTENPPCLVEIYGLHLGKKYALDRLETTIGREENNTIMIEMDSVSRQHAKVVVERGYVLVEDLKSTNGTFINDREVNGPTPLRSGDRVKIGGTIFKYIDGADIENLYHEEIYRLTIIDGLTGIYNKRYFMEAVEREFVRCKRYARPLSLIMFDIDHFKLVNDEHGHIAGDYVLRHLCAIIKDRVRAEEIFSRYGGEEFAILLPEREADKGAIFAEKIRALVEAEAFSFEGKTIPVTISLGVAQLAGQDTAMELIADSDQNLYAAKNGGRNRVCCVPLSPDEPA